MSAIGGIFDLRGAAIPGEALVVLETGMARLAADSFTRTFHGFVAMTFGAFDTLPRDAAPRLTEAGGAVIALDGRIDNASELPKRPCSGSDSAACLRSYLDYGVQAFSRWIGDFAVAIWNQRSRELVLARDPFGVRPLYYHLNRHRVAWSSAIEALLALPGVSDEISEEYLVQYIVADPESFRTPFREIKAVPPGHYLRFTSAGCETGCFWDLLERQQRLPLRNDGEWEEAFRHYFFDAVRASLRAEEPVFAQLSGGLDSSSIVGAADHLAAQGAVSARVKTLSFVFDRRRHADEREFIAIVERNRQAPGIHLREDDAPVLSSWPGRDFIAFPSPQFCFGGRLQQVFDAMRPYRSRVLLSGWGGDQLCLNEGAYVAIADLVARLRWVKAWRRSLAHARAERGSAAHLLAKAFLKAACNNAANEFIAIPDWVTNRSAVKKAVDPLRWRRHERIGRATPPSLRRRWLSVQFTIDHTTAGYAAFPSATQSLEVRYPFLHRPLVEFLCNTPVDQLIRPGERRSLVRRALRHIIPPEICRRSDKRGPDEAVVHGVDRAWSRLSELFATSRLERLGIIDSRLARDELQRVRHGVGHHRQSVLRLISLEMWVRAVEERRNNLHAPHRSLRINESLLG